MWGMEQISAALAKKNKKHVITGRKQKKDSHILEQKDHALGVLGALIAYGMNRRASF